MISTNEEFFTVAEVAELLKLNQQTIRNWIDDGTLPAIRVGARRIRIRRAALEQFLEQSRTTTRSEQPTAPAQAFWDGETVAADAGKPAA